MKEENEEECMTVIKEHNAYIIINGGYISSLKYVFIHLYASLFNKPHLFLTGDYEFIKDVQSKLNECIEN